jgi:catechol 2,3-dioxygenase-like lactoylglutathione lyase family enzyme
LTPRPRLGHLALAVRDQARSRRFSETHFGFAFGHPDSVRRVRENVRADGVELVEASWEIPQPNE